MANCANGDITCWLTNQADIFQHLAENLVPIEKLLTGGAYLLGIFFAIKAILSLKHFGEGRMGGGQKEGLKEPLIYFLVSAVFLYFPTAFAILMNTTFGYSNVLAYSSISSSNQTISTLFGSGSSIGQSLSLVIQVIGMVAFFRGWLLIARSGSQGQPGNVSKGLIHIFGGILAMNIVGTLQVLNNTLYGS